MNTYILDLTEINCCFFVLLWVNLLHRRGKWMRSCHRHCPMSFWGFVLWMLVFGCPVSTDQEARKCGKTKSIELKHCRIGWPVFWQTKKIDRKNFPKWQSRRHRAYRAQRKIDKAYSPNRQSESSKLAEQWKEHSACVCSISLVICSVSDFRIFSHLGNLRVIEYDV